MKSVLIVLVILVIGGIVWYSIQTKPDASVPAATVSDVSNATEEKNVVADENVNKPVAQTKEIDNANVKITFKGFGPGKVHDGSFSKIDSKLSFDASGSLKGEVVVDMSSLSTDNEGKLTPHLKSADFFDIAKYPTASFKITSLKDGKLSGVMTAHGVSKNVSFDVVSSDKELSSKFNIDMKEFGINQKFANEVIELTVTVPLK